MRTNLLTHSLPEWTKPKWVDAVLVVDPVEEILGSRGRQQDVLDDVVLRHTILMQAMVERFGVEEWVE